MTTTVMVTGANRGIGLEFVKQYAKAGIKVIATCRQSANCDELMHLCKRFDHISLDYLDISDCHACQLFEKKYQSHRIDIAIANAGIYGTRREAGDHMDFQNILEVIETNAIGTLLFANAITASLAKGEAKKLVIIGSKMGSISHNDNGGAYAYRMSKCALNIAMQSYAIDHEHLGIKVLTLHPGWVRTHIGGKFAPTSANQSVHMMRELIEQRGTVGRNIFLDTKGNTIAW